MSVEGVMMMRTSFVASYFCYSFYCWAVLIFMLNAKPCQVKLAETASVDSGAANWRILYKPGGCVKDTFFILVSIHFNKQYI